MILTSEEISLLSANPLFKGFPKEEISHVLYCLGAFKKTFAKNTFLFEEGDRADFAVLLLRGQVDLVRYGEEGNTSIFESFSPGESFGEAYALKAETVFGVSALAKEDGVALYIHLRQLLEEMNCVYGQNLMKNLLLVLASKDMMMKDKLNVLGQKGLKGKVMEYLLSFSQGKKREYFPFPYSRQEMADYLGCDRSALSRLLSQMKKEGLILYRKHEFLIK
jgi:CRP-like cAMP-binding protein